MEIGNELAFELNYRNEEQAIAAAFEVADLFEASLHVESWGCTFKLCPDCGQHVILSGKVTTFFSGEALIEVGRELSAYSESGRGYMGGQILAVNSPA
jgi:hypothetical protein